MFHSLTYDLRCASELGRERISLAVQRMISVDPAGYDRQDQTEGRHGKYDCHQADPHGDTV